MMTDDIGFLLNKATRRFRLAFAERLGDTGLRPLQAAALMAIARNAEGRLTPSQLTDAVNTDAPTTSGLLDRLERDGWVATTPNPDDRRSRFVRLTNQAEAALPTVLAAAGEVSQQATACLSADELRTLESLLARLCEDAADAGAKRVSR